jgi:hypothetical protein
LRNAPERLWLAPVGILLLFLVASAGWGAPGPKVSRPAMPACKVW